MTTMDIGEWMTADQVASKLPRGNADWVRRELREGRLRGSKVRGTWYVEPDAVREMLESASNDPARSKSATSRRRRQRSLT